MPISVAVLTRKESDLLALLRGCPGLSVSVLSPLCVTPQSLQGFDCACVLGGTDPDPLVLPAPSRSAVEAFSQTGKRVFWEYALSFDQNYCRPPASTRYLRLSCTDEAFAHIPEGTLLDDQCNQHAAPYYHNHLAKPILMYKQGLTQHAREVLSQKDQEDFSQYGLWLERPGVAVCSFRLCNFVRARFAPKVPWQTLVQSLLEWLCGVSLGDLHFSSAYVTGQPLDLKDCAQAAIQWFAASDTLLDDGAAGVREGFGTEVYPDGTQKAAPTVRTDCVGEAALPASLRENGGGRPLRSSGRNRHARPAAGLPQDHPGTERNRRGLPPAAARLLAVFCHWQRARPGHALPAGTGYGGFPPSQRRVFGMGQRLLGRVQQNRGRRVLSASPKRRPGGRPALQQ
ncbi:MAG: hypothetical protein HFE94_03015 [Acutalibacter sp.]|nr:hypothetical protein [Acutalibacter sp.]